MLLLDVNISFGSAASHDCAHSIRLPHSVSHVSVGSQCLPQFRPSKHHTSPSDPLAFPSYSRDADRNTSPPSLEKKALIVSYQPPRNAFPPCLRELAPSLSTCYRTCLQDPSSHHRLTGSSAHHWCRSLQAAKAPLGPPPFSSLVTPTQLLNAGTA